MGTRSGIGILNGDGTVTSIYCHWDSYPDHHAPILAEHYNSEEKARALLAPGDMSSLAASVGERHDFNERPEGQCTYYGRDRGETGTEPKEFATFVTWEREAWSAYGGDYLYIFRDGAWHFRGRSGSWSPCVDFVTKEADETDAA